MFSRAQFLAAKMWETLLAHELIAHFGDSGRRDCQPLTRDCAKSLAGVDAGFGIELNLPMPAPSGMARARASMNRPANLHGRHFLDYCHTRHVPIKRLKNSAYCSWTQEHIDRR